MGHVLFLSRARQSCKILSGLCVLEATISGSSEIVPAAFFQDCGQAYLGGGVSHAGCSGLSLTSSCWFFAELGSGSPECSFGNPHI